MPIFSLRSAALLLALGTLSSCDTGLENADELVGDYELVRYGGASLPSGGVTGGELRLYLDQTIPSFQMEWVHDGTAFSRGGLYTRTGSALELTVTSGGAVEEYGGAVLGDEITVSVDDGAFTTFTFRQE